MNNNPMQCAADVLLIVGDVDELGQIRHSLQRAKINNRLHHVGDAIEARAYLRREGPYMLAPTPGLVLLDAGLPGNGVIDLIAELKTNKQFDGIAVVVLVGSDAENQLIENCIYAVDGSIYKPFDLPELAETLVSVDTLSFLVVQSAPAK